MLDNDTLEAGLGADVIEEGNAPEGEDQGEDESLEIVIEGDEPESAPEDQDDDIEAELGDRGKRALQAARKAAKDAAAKARAAEAELAAERALKAIPVEDDPLPEKPTIEGCNYNTDVYDEKLREYFAAEQKVKAKKEAMIADAQAEAEDYQKRLGNYVTSKQSMRVADFDTAEAMVRSKLTQIQQSIIIRNSENPANMILALGRSKKALDDLSAIKDADRFAFALAKTEGKITVTQKSPPPPESKIRGGGSVGGSTSFASQLAAAEKEADRTGDRSKIAAIRRDMKAAGVKI